MIVELKGVEFSNKGAALMLETIVQQLRTRFPDVEIALSDNPKSPYSKRKTVATYRKISLRKLWLDCNALTYYLPRWFHKILGSFGFILEGGVDAIIDASGFSYSDQWSPYMSIYHLCGEMDRMHRFNKPYIFLPQAFGPFSDPKCVDLLKRHLTKAKIIYARDEASFNHLAKIIGKPTHLLQSCDFTNSIKRNQALGMTLVSDLASPRACIIVNYNMIQKRNQYPEWQANYVRVVQSLIGIYQDMGFCVFFLNHEGEDDAQLITQINDLLPLQLPVLTPESALEVKQVIGQSDTVFSSRYHGCISALSQGIGCLGTSWSHKYEALYSDYEVSEWLLGPHLTDLELRQTVERALSPETLKKLAQKAHYFEHQSAGMWENVMGVLDV